jgi:ssDNA-binding Zn-finger/Zn-ribbon topoisomerase 1
MKFKEANNGVTLKCGRKGCNGALVVRRSTKDNSLFFGCSRYPKCEYSINGDISKCPTCDRPLNELFK